SRLPAPVSHGPATGILPGKPSARMVLIRDIPGRVLRGLVSTTISARPVGQLFVGPEVQAPHDLASRLRHLTIRLSPASSVFRKKHVTSGRLPSKCGSLGHAAAASPRPFLRLSIRFPDRQVTPPSAAAPKWIGVQKSPRSKRYRRSTLHAPNTRTEM